MLGISVRVLEFSVPRLAGFLQRHGVNAAGIGPRNNVCDVMSSRFLPDASGFPLVWTLSSPARGGRCIVSAHLGDDPPSPLSSGLSWLSSLHIC